MHQSVTNAFQKILNGISKPSIDGSFPEQFALKRFAKKFEIPDDKLANARKLKTFENWRDYDSGLQKIHLPSKEWYLARLMIHEIMRGFRFGELTFTGGSQSEPLLGMHSIADKLLTHSWEVSPSCVDLFVSRAYRDKAFLKAAKIRLRRSHGDEWYRNTCKRIYRYNSSSDDVRKYILYACCVSREASRYSTVRKNNEIDRSIDLQPFINMLVQRAIGLGLRELIRNKFDLVLEDLQPIHGLMIKDRGKSTIDLKNASDSNTWSLVEFLFPPWFVGLLRQATPWYTEGLDGHFYVTNKVSSMGNGFTFELMTLTLLATVRQIDYKGSVFGDDIVISSNLAPRLLTVLDSSGWVVNVEKTFIHSSFRESCGYNYHDDFGYLRSFDFEYPKTIGDCIVFFNKLALLKEIPYFKKIHDLLYRAIPTALRGPMPKSISAGLTHEPDTCLDGFFFCEKFPMTSPSQVAIHALNLHWEEWEIHYSYEYRARVRFSRRNNLKMSVHSLLYFTYMQAGRMSDIVLTGLGDWVKVAYISNGSFSVRMKSLMHVNYDL